MVEKCTCDMPNDLHRDMYVVQSQKQLRLRVQSCPLPPSFWPKKDASEGCQEYNA